MALATDQVTELVDRSLECLAERIEITAAYVFGSYVDGTPHEYSDIDLAVFSPEVGRMALQDRLGLFADVQKSTGNRVELHLYPASTLANARPTNFYGYVIEHGRRVR